MAEQVALVDASGTVVGSAPRPQVRRDNLLHAATAVLLRDPAGHVYLHRRSDDKDWAPGQWDAAAGGMLQAGEEAIASAARELEEELGVVGATLRPMGSHLYQDDSVRVFEHAYEVLWDGPVAPRSDEVVEGHWATLEDLAEFFTEPDFRFVPDTRHLLDLLARSGQGDYAQLRALAAALGSGIPFEVTRHRPVRSLEEAAAARGVAPRQVLKTMVVRVSEGDHRLVLVPGDREIAWPKLRALLGVNRLSMPPAEAARALTGYARGTITPFGTLTPLPVVLDATADGVVSLGAGAHGVALLVEAGALARALRATVADVTDADAGDAATRRRG
jgi:Cys-tRNA(Pro)/Cys-tRNA(Cys) deacylase